MHLIDHGQLDGTAQAAAARLEAWSRQYERENPWRYKPSTLLISALATA